jgi:hypothetical protein
MTKFGVAIIEDGPRGYEILVALPSLWTSKKEEVDDLDDFIISDSIKEELVQAFEDSEEPED